MQHVSARANGVVAVAMRQLTLWPGQAHSKCLLAQSQRQEGRGCPALTLVTLRLTPCSLCHPLLALQSKHNVAKSDCMKECSTCVKACAGLSGALPSQCDAVTKNPYKEAMEKCRAEYERLSSSTFALQRAFREYSSGC